MTLPAPKQRAKRASAILIGNELLSGAIRDANLQELAQTLRSLGIALERVVIVRDIIEDIAREVRDQSARFDVVFTSGGVGPTHDDVTIAAVARAFDVELKLDQLLLAAMRGPLSSIPTAVLERMAKVPIGAQTVSSAFSWPTIVMRNVWVLPGVPSVFRQKLRVVRQCLCGDGTFTHRAVRCRSDELLLLASIDRVVEAYRAVSIGSYPAATATDPQTRVTFDGIDSSLVEAACHFFVSMLTPDEVLGIESDSTSDGAE